MTSPANITVELKGPRGSATLSDFSVVCSTLRNCLRNVARCVIGEEEVEFDLSDLRRSSAFIEVAPMPNGKPMDDLVEVSQVFRDTVKALEAGRGIDPRLDFRTLGAFNGFSALARKRKTLLSLGGTQVTAHFADHVYALLQPDSTALGSITGRLEAISLHNESKFTLYPPVEGEDVDCIFQRSDLENVLQAVDHNVTVYGTLHFSKAKSFPVRVDVDDWEVLPDPDALPTLLDLRGALKHPARAGNQQDIADEWT
jgi:hypothetical protein